MASNKHNRRLPCSECGMSFDSEVEYGEHIRTHERGRTTPSPVPATERYHEGNPGGIVGHEASGPEIGRKFK